MSQTTQYRREETLVSPEWLRERWSSDTPERRWIIPEWLPLGCATLFAGSGGAGKSRIAVQTCAVLAAQFDEWMEPTDALQRQGKKAPYIGLPPEDVRGAFYASWEDDADEIERRIPHYWKDAYLNTGLLSACGSSAAMWAGDDKVSGLTGYGRWILSEAERRRAALLVIDPVANAFSGNENSRTQVSGFVGTLNEWAAKNQASVLLLAHPSKNVGDPYSGSTAWRNAVRSAWTLTVEDVSALLGVEKPKSDLHKPYARKLTLEKYNYTSRGRSVWLKSEYPLFATATAEEAAADYCSQQGEGERGSLYGAASVV